MGNNNENMKVVGSLDGINGNAFSLMAYFKKLARKQGFENEWIEAVLNDAMSRDYNHLLNTLDNHMTEEYI